MHLSDEKKYTPLVVHPLMTTCVPPQPPLGWENLLNAPTSSHKGAYSSNRRRRLISPSETPAEEANVSSETQCGLLVFSVLSVDLTPYIQGWKQVKMADQSFQTLSLASGFATYCGSFATTAALVVPDVNGTSFSICWLSNNSPSWPLPL
ncbi:hypothetical protein PoB_002186500 [Plakobranchus ocellatus]|uniref:Uncharacterized protein n=1 Tax=Plakobranchus ocellatus TaxID=259542 RepID=A0AAV3ZI94_9GAST|nr:hypothetical protein PoB_002186500 [Plakobranchus ocellatus]